jgi:hypothetical protein
MAYLALREDVAGGVRDDALVGRQRIRHTALLLIHLHTFVDRERGHTGEERGAT